jgi:hypothetical protein
VSSGAVEWLAQYGDDVPPELLEAMQKAIAAVPAGSAAQHLADAALASLRSALHRCDERVAALPLLAADALMTAACELAAGEGDDALAALCAAHAPERMAEVVPLP